MHTLTHFAPIFPFRQKNGKSGAICADNGAGSQTYYATDSILAKTGLACGRLLGLVDCGAKNIPHARVICFFGCSLKSENIGHGGFCLDCFIEVEKIGFYLPFAFLGPLLRALKKLRLFALIGPVKF